MMYRSLLRSLLGSRLALAAGAACLFLASCSDTVLPSRVLGLDRPSAVSFGCFGPRWIESAEVTVRGPMPTEACTLWADNMTPPGQEPVAEVIKNEPPSTLGFILQKAQGSVSVAEINSQLPFPTLDDADPLTPGQNAIPVGILPVDIATHPSGCYFATANAGTCDVSVVDVESVASRSKRPTVQRVPLTDAAGDRIDARPAAMVADTRSASIGAVCPAQPDNWLMYIAYPDCNAVAAIDVASGQAVAAIQLDDAGVATITSGDLDCTAATRCGGVVPAPDATAPRPVALELAIERDEAGVETSRRLYIGSENSPSLFVVDLDDQYLPAGLYSIVLEGDVGVIRLAATRLLTLSGGNIFRFVYSIATDGTVRVADVHNLRTECETQPDTRFLHDETDALFLGCMPLQDPRTPPRRVYASSPGIPIGGSAVATDIAFAHVDATGGDTEPSPTTLVGDFAYITLSNGQVMIVNVFDQAVSGNGEIAVALPHHIRDTGTRRDEAWPDSTCAFPDSNTANVSYGPRLASALQQTRTPALVDSNHQYLLPDVRAVTCAADMMAVPVPELAIQAGTPARRLAFPDWTSVFPEEAWSVTWEGNLFDTHPGLVSFQGGAFAITDASGSLCRLGIEPGDSVLIQGCDPTRGDNDCRLGETCHVDPTSNVLSTGLCLPTDRLGELSADCRGILATRRRYTVDRVDFNRVVLKLRPQVLRTTPLDGCIDSTQCANELWPRTVALAAPADSVTPPALSCLADRAAFGDDKKRCVFTCNDDSEDISNKCDSKAGFACVNGRCVEGVVPPAECLAGVQHIAAFASNAFTVRGSTAGYLHHRTVDPATGRCIDDAAASPLLAGRIPLTAPPCQGNGVEDLAPNPCLVTTDHSEPEDACTAAAGTVRQVQAIRFRNPAMTFHIVDPVTRRDPQLGSGADDCNPDPSKVEIPIVYPGYSLGLQIEGGLGEMRLAMNGIATTTSSVRLSYPTAIVEGPLHDLWIMDEGDRRVSGLIVNGQVVRFIPSDPFGSSFYIQ